jgi:replicative DNA helicase
MNIPPHSREAEAAVLGSILRDNHCVGDVQRLLRVEDFYLGAHQDVYRAILDLSEAGSAIDLVTLANLLNGRDQINEFGDSPYAFLATFWEAAPTAANVEHYASIVRTKAVCRGLVHIGDEISLLGYGQSGPAEELVAKAESLIVGLSNTTGAADVVPLGDAVREALDRYDTVAGRGSEYETTGLSTGLLDLDRMTAGMHPGELIFIAARPSVGKTTLGLCIARHVAVALGVPVFFASLEQSRSELAERLLCTQGGVNGMRVRKGMLNKDEQERMVAAGDILRKAPLWVDDCAGQSASRIAGNIRRYRDRNNIGLAVIDYIGLMQPDSEKRNQSREQEISGISRRLKCLAKDAGIPIIVIAQLNRQGAEQRPMLHMLRDSGAQEQDADVVILLHETQEEIGCLEIIVAKQRNGPRDTVKATFRKEYFQITNHCFDFQHST